MRHAHSATPRTIGWREHIALPDLGITLLKAKVDTGARTSALHAVDIVSFKRDGETWISFKVPLADTLEQNVCEARVIDERDIKNTSGRAETRYVIRTSLVIGRRHWLIELSLADREQMGFDLILGRTALRRHGLVVDPGRSYLSGLPVLKSPVLRVGHSREMVDAPTKKFRRTDELAPEEEE